MIAEQNARILQKHVEMCNNEAEYDDERVENSYFAESEFIESGSEHFDKLNKVVNIGELKLALAGNRRWFLI